jgi:hypothetical protein
LICEYNIETIAPHDRHALLAETFVKVLLITRVNLVDAELVHVRLAVHWHGIEKTQNHQNPSPSAHHSAPLRPFESWFKGKTFLEATSRFSQMKLCEPAVRIMKIISSLKESNIRSEFGKPVETPANLPAAGFLGGRRALPHLSGITMLRKIFHVPSGCFCQAVRYFSTSFLPLTNVASAWPHS